MNGGIPEMAKTKRTKAAKKGARTRKMKTGMRKAKRAMGRAKSGAKRMVSSRAARRTSRTPRRTSRKARPGTIAAVMKKMERKGHGTLTCVEKKVAARSTMIANARRMARNAAD